MSNVTGPALHVSGLTGCTEHFPVSLLKSLQKTSSSTAGIRIVFFGEWVFNVNLLLF